MPATRARGRTDLEMVASQATAPTLGQQGSPYGRRRVDPSEPLENWYKDQLLQKLEDLSVTKYHQLRNSKKTTIIKAIRNLQSNSLPAPQQQQHSVQQQQQHGVQQQQQLHATGRQQNGGLADDNNTEDRTVTTLEDRIESTVRRILPEVVQAVVSTQQRLDSCPPSMDCGRSTSDGNTNSEQTNRPRPIQTNEGASEFIVQAQGLPAQGLMNYQGAPTALGAQQTDFASLSAGTGAGEHSGTIFNNGRSNVVYGGGITRPSIPNSMNERVAFDLNSMLGTGPRGSVINHHPNSGNSQNLNEGSLGTNSTQATNGSTQVVNRGDTIRVADQPGQPLMGQGGMGSVSGLPQVQGHNFTSHPTWGPRPAFLNQPTPLVHGISEGAKKKAWSGQYVPLYMFLPGYDDQDASATLVPTQQEDGSFILTAQQSEKEKRLSKRALNPTEFVNAFSRYKEVILERFPERARELDAYMMTIVELATKYTGRAYWQYHIQFAKQAASLWTRGVRADWSVIDPVILHKAIASERAHFCEYCQDALHATTACPFTLSTSSAGTGTTKPTASNNRLPRTKIYHKGVEVCGNFNWRESGCNLKNCNYVMCVPFASQRNMVDGIVKSILVASPPLND